MKREFTITLEEIEYSIVAEDGATTINGHPFTVEITDDPSTGSGQGGMVLVNGIAYDVTLEGETVTVGAESYTIQVSGLAATSPAPTPSAPATTPAAAGEGAVTAIMPGKIMRVLVEVGDQVAEGDVVCVLEAMKMENELHAHKTGEVKAVHVSSGDDVEMGAVLVEIE